MNQACIFAANPVVAVVDDDAAVGNSLRFSLELEGFRVRVFSTGGAVLHASDLDDCACFVVDQNMPGLSGLDLIARLRDRQPSPPVILITTHPSTATRKRAALAGVAIVEKPFLGNALLDAIRDICGKAAN
jgi:FixJ family two-component response regulator